MALSLISQLHTWWKQCVSIAGPLEVDSIQWQNSRIEPAMNQYIDPDHFPLLPHSDMPTAALGSLYDATSVVALRLLYLVSSSAYLYENRVQKHLESIQSAREFIAATPSPAAGRGSLMVELPLRIIKSWAPALQKQATGLQNGRNSVRDDGDVDSSTELFGHVASYIYQLNMGIT
jgi:hypothetical protein